MKALIALAVVAVIVLAIFLGMSYRIDVGATAANPLGDFAKVEKELVGMGLRKTNPDPGEAQGLFGDRLQITDGMTATSYVDLVPGLRHQTIVVRAADGKIAGLLSHFRSGSQTFSKTGTKCENFTALYWQLLSGKEPSFTKKSEGGGDGREYLWAEFKRAGADATWKKESGGATLMITQEISDTVVFVAH